MIYNQIIDSKNINIKKKLKYSEHCTLIPIKYNNDDLIIQTPKMYIPFGEKYVYNNKNKKYVDISFLNIENDNNIKIFYNNLNTIFDKINNFYKYDVDDIIKKYNKNDLLRLKITKNILIYNQKRENIDKIINNTYGSFIIHLYGLWLMNDTLYFHWELLQCKIDIPIYLSEYSFIDDVKPIFNKGKGKGKGKFIPPPPPPPPEVESKYDKMIKMGIPKDAVLQKMRLEETPRVINPKDLQNVKLKKTIIKEKQKSDDMPYLAELLKRIKLFSNV
tara:strand:- start:201 stop:1025 length:825 start_codon:yes stop_codon:yes gene_type:complete